MNDARAKAYEDAAAAITVAMRGSLERLGVEVVVELTEIRDALERAAKHRRESP